MRRRWERKKYRAAERYIPGKMGKQEKKALIGRSGFTL